MATIWGSGSTLTLNATNLSQYVSWSAGLELDTGDPTRVRPGLHDPISACPFKPGTEDWRQWQQDYLRLHPSINTGADHEFDRDVEERELGRRLTYIDPLGHALWRPTARQEPGGPPRRDRRQRLQREARPKRPVAPSAQACHHGNPKNRCRDCSMGRR